MAKSKGGAIESKLRDYALGFPDAYEEESYRAIAPKKLLRKTQS